MKLLPLVWAALWRNRAESILTLLALTVAFALFGTMIAWVIPDAPSGHRMCGDVSDT